MPQTAKELGAFAMRWCDDDAYEEVNGTVVLTTAWSGSDADPQTLRTCLIALASALGFAPSEVSIATTLSVASLAVGGEPSLRQAKADASAQRRRLGPGPLPLGRHLVPRF